MYTDAGEDLVVSCSELRLRGQPGEGDVEARRRCEDLASSGDGKPELVHTPGQKTIEDVARFLGVSPKNKIKTLAYVMTENADAKNEAAANARPGGPYARRPHAERGQVARGAIGGKEYRPMQEEEIQTALQLTCRISRSIAISSGRLTRKIRRNLC